MRTRCGLIAALLLLSAGAFAQVTLKIDKTEYRAGETITVQFAGGPGGYTDGINLYRKDGGTWHMAGGKFVWGKKQGQMELTAKEPGEYQVRYETEKWQQLAAQPLRVTAATTAPPTESAASHNGVPGGVYQTYFHGYNGWTNKWLAGDITIRTASTYEFQNKTGSYYFDAASRRIVWKDGPLQGVYARWEPTSGLHTPAIVLPRKENDAAGHKLAISDVWGYLKH